MRPASIQYELSNLGITSKRATLVASDPGLRWWPLLRPRDFVEATAGRTCSDTSSKTG